MELRYKFSDSPTIYGLIFGDAGNVWEDFESVDIISEFDGQVKIKGANIAIQADEDIDLIAGRNINVNGKAKVLLKGNKVQADGLIGNLVESTSGSFLMRIFEGDGILPDDAKVGMDYLASSAVTDALGGVKAIAGIGNPSIGLAANVLGSFI